MKKIFIVLLGLILVGSIWGHAKNAYALMDFYHQINNMGQVVCQVYV